MPKKPSPERMPDEEHVLLRARIDVLELELQRSQTMADDRILAILQNRTNEERLRDRELDDVRKRNGFLEDALACCEKVRDPDRTCVRPYWSGRNFSIDSKLCFLLMPFTQPWSDPVWDTLVRAATDQKLDCLRASQGIGSRVMEDIWSGICRARVVIADLTGNNPNVTYEVGLADVVGKDVLLLSQSSAPGTVPFNFLGRRLIEYHADDAGYAKLRQDVARRLDSLLSS